MTDELSEDAAPAPPRRRKSLRAQGLIATLALLAYLVVSGLYIAHEREPLYEGVQALQALARHERSLAVAEAAVRSALGEVSRAVAPADLVAALDQAQGLVASLAEFDPGYALIERTIARGRGAIEADGAGGRSELAESIDRAAAELEIRRARLADERAALVDDYQRGYDAVTIETLAAATFGLVGFGSLALWYFARLARDIRRLEMHARRIVQGSRGVTLPVEREDELGRLMQAVNRMAVDLDERERRIALEGERRSHQDKMLAVAALASGMAHEVNNPLTVIAGTAQAIRAEAAPAPAAVAEAADTILAHARRAGQAARALAEAAAPQSTERDWFDLAALVRRALRWMGYDRRYRHVEFTVDADPALPAIFGAADVVQQVLMRLLGLMCDAAARESSRSHAEVQVRTIGDRAVVMVSGPAVPDLGEADVQRQLVLARALLAPLGAELAITQDQGGAGTLTLVLPLSTDPP